MDPVARVRACASWLGRLLGSFLEGGGWRGAARRAGEVCAPGVRTLLGRWLGTRRDLAIDLGTTHIRVARDGGGPVESYPAVVALRTDAHGERSLLLVGEAARQMLGRTPPAVRAVRPLQGGALVDVQAAELLLRHAIQGGGRSWVRPHVAIAVPSGTTPVERRALREAVLAAGARHIHLIPSALAAAIGAGMPVAEPRGSMIVDVGGGTTDVAVISLGGMVRAASARVGGDDMDQAIRTAVRRKLDLSIGDESAEQIKLALGRARRGAEPRKLVVKGSDLVGRQPKAVEVDSETVIEAVSGTVEDILVLVHRVLENVPPEIAADLVDTGITLTGNGSRLPDLDVALEQSTGLPVERAADPDSAVVLGCRRCLDDPALLAESELT